METFLRAVSSVLIIFLLTSLGYFCAVKGWMDAAVKRFISKFLMAAALPATCIYELTENLDRGDIFASLPLLLAGTASQLVTLLIAYLTARFLLHTPRVRFGVFLMMCCTTNAMFIGLAMCTGIFGPACTIYVMMFYMVNTFVNQLVCQPIVRSTGTVQGGKRVTVLDLLKTPTVLGVLAGFVLVALDIQLPYVPIQVAKIISGTSTPLALLLTGYIIYETGLKNLHITRDHLIVMLFRFLICPAVGIGICALLGINGMARDVLIVELAMPVLSMSVVYASAYGADERFAAEGSALTTLACFVVIPVLTMIL